METSINIANGECQHVAVFVEGVQFLRSLCLRSLCWVKDHSIFGMCCRYIFCSLGNAWLC